MVALLSETENQILASLPDGVRRRLLPDLQQVLLALNHVVYEQDETIRHIYFPTSAVAALLLMTEDGASVEVGMIGRDGMIGAEVALGANVASHHVVVQIAGRALRTRTAKLAQQLAECEILRSEMSGYCLTLANQFCARAVANCRQTLVERLSGWLLMVHERAVSDTLPLTQEVVAERLGVRRAGGSVAMNRLAAAGAIRYGRGAVTLLNRRNLKTVAGEI